MSIKQISQVINTLLAELFFLLLLLQNELKSDVGRLTTHVQTCLVANQVVANLLSRAFFPRFGGGAGKGPSALGTRLKRIEVCSSGGISRNDNSLKRL